MTSRQEIIILYILAFQSLVFAVLIGEAKNAKYNSMIYVLFVGFSMAICQLIVFTLLGTLALSILTDMGVL